MRNHPFDYTEVRSLKPEELFSVIDEWVNCNASGGCPKGFSDALNSTHRTLQESFVAMMWNCLVQYGRDHQEEFSFDARNEDAVMLCRRLAGLVENEELTTYLRYI